MPDSPFVRLALIGAIFACATPALAGENFFGRTVGSFSFTDPDPPLLAGTIEQFFISFKGPVLFETLSMTFEITRRDSGPDDMIGTFTFFGSDLADSLSGSYTGINFPNDDGVWTGVAEWTVISGTGAFEGLTGEGTLTTALFIDDNSASTAFNGAIIPAPAAFALLAAPFAFAIRRTNRIRVAQAAR